MGGGHSSPNLETLAGDAGGGTSWAGDDIISGDDQGRGDAGRRSNGRSEGRILGQTVGIVGAGMLFGRLRNFLRLFFITEFPDSLWGSLTGLAYRYVGDQYYS